jgi:hypothetical protein
MRNAVSCDMKTRLLPHRRHYVSATEPNRLMLCKIWGFHGAMRNAFCDIKTQFVPHRKHYVFATEPSRLMLCENWGFHDDDYEECRLLGYKTPVRTSQETHYISATEPSRLMLCKIWDFHGGDYEDTVFWDVTRCDSCKNRRFGGTDCLQYQGDKNLRARNNVSSD